MALLQRGYTVFVILLIIYNFFIFTAIGCAQPVGVKEKNTLATRKAVKNKPVTCLMQREGGTLL